MLVDVNFQAAIVGNPVIGNISYLRLVKGCADQLTVFEEREGKGDVAADPVLVHIQRIAFDIIKLIHIESGRINTRIFPLQEAQAWPCTCQVPEIQPEHGVILGLRKGFQRPQLMELIVIAEMLVARIHKIRFPGLDEIDVVEQDKAAPVLLVLHTQRVGKRQYLLGILNNGKTKIRISHPAVGIVQEALALNVNDLCSGRECQEKKTTCKTFRNRP